MKKLTPLLCFCMISGLGLSQNVGINTTQPQDALHISQGDLRIDNTAPQLRFFRGSIYSSFLQQNLDDLIISNREPGNLIFRTDNSTHMLMDEFGKIGIGTNIPLEKLYIDQGSIGINNVAPEIKLFQDGINTSFFRHRIDDLEIGNEEAGSIFFRTNNVTQVTIDSSGNMGLGTLSPLTKLYVNDGEITSNASLPQFSLYRFGSLKSYIQQNGENLFIANSENGDISLRTLDLPRMTLDQDGKIGIGTTAPIEKLHLKGGSFRIENITPQVQFYQGSTFGAFIQSNLNHFQISNLLNGDFQLMTNNLSRITIKNDGDIGIGTNSPVEKLHVKDGSVGIEATNPQLQFYQSGSVSGFVQSAGDKLQISNKMNGNLDLLTNDLARLSIINNGHIGVGTVTPQARLHLRHGNLRIENSLPQLDFYQGSNISAYFQSSGNNLAIANTMVGGINLITNSQYRLSIIHSGNIGIGTGSPATKLHVKDGSIRIEDQNPTIQFNHGSTIGAWVESVNNNFQFVNNQSGDIQFSTSGINRVSIKNDGAVVIGSVSAPAFGYKLSVDGKVISEELKVQLSQNWPDYVFDDEYHLMELSDIKEFITTNKHLPGVPSAKQIENDNGFEVGEMNRILLEKIEELTLHVIKLNEQIIELQKGNNQLHQN